MFFFRLITLLLIFSINSLSGQSTLQIINNALNENGIEAITLDFYFNDILFYEGLNTREATPFLILPVSHVQEEIKVAISPSNSSSNAFLTIPLSTSSLNADHQLVLNGILNHPSKPITPIYTNNGKLEADSPEEIEIAFFNGAINSPNIDIDLRLTGTMFSDVEYGELDSYFPLPSQLYYWDIRATGSSNISHTFEANLSLVPGVAITVFSSAYWEDSSFGLFAAFANGSVVPLLETGAARLQLIQAAAVGPIDIYFDEDLLFDNFNYTSASPYFFWRSDTSTTIAVAPGNSTSVEDAIYFFQNNIFEDRSNKILVFAGSPVNNSFSLFIDDGQPIGSSITNFDAKFFHAWTTGPSIELNLFGESQNLTNLSFGEFSEDYVPLISGINILDMNDSTDDHLIAQFYNNLTGGGGLSGLIFSVGQYDINHPNPNYNWFLVLSNGNVIPFIPVTRVQFIQNFALNEMDSIDVYFNNNLSFDDLAFRSATPYLFAATRFDYSTGIAGRDSEGPDQIIFNLPAFRFKDGVDYVAILNGLPNDPQYSLEWHFFEDALINADNGTEVLFHNGSIVPGNLDLSLNGGEVLFEGLAYGDFQAYRAITPSLIDYDLLSSNPIVNLSGQSDWTAYDDLAINIFSSGAINRDGVAALALWAALPNGNTFPLSTLTKQNLIENSPISINVYPNPAMNYTFVEYSLEKPSDIAFFLTNAKGQIVYQKQKSDQISGNYLEKIETRHLPEGKYILSVTGNQWLRSKKIFIIH
jgi:hypothetical protein